MLTRSQQTYLKKWNKSYGFMGGRQFFDATVFRALLDEREEVRQFALRNIDPLDATEEDQVIYARLKVKL